MTFEGDDEATGIVAAHAEMGIGGRMILVGLRYHDRYRRGGDGRVALRRARDVVPLLHAR